MACLHQQSATAAAILVQLNPCHPPAREPFLEQTADANPLQMCDPLFFIRLQLSLNFALRLFGKLSSLLLANTLRLLK